MYRYKEDPNKKKVKGTASANKSTVENNTQNFNWCMYKHITATYYEHSNK